jgi:lipoprotein-releasing system ATP-binding protein
MSVLSMHNVTKTYKSGEDILLIIDKVDFSVESGESVVITGESGSGKSTFLNLIGGLDSPDEGDIYAGSLKLTGSGETVLSRYRNEQTGFIFQFHYLLKDFTALENVMMPGRIRGLNKKVLSARAEELLDRVGLGGRRDHYPGQLSGGERQRVAMARALMNEPPLILADEPTGSLDEKNSRVVEDLLFQLCREAGTTLIMVTHDQLLASRGSRQYKLHAGSLIKK